MKKLHLIVVLGLTASVNCGNVSAGAADAANGIKVTQTNTNNTSTAVSATAELGGGGPLVGFNGRVEAGGGEGAALADSVLVKAPSGNATAIDITQENKNNTSVAVGGNTSANSVHVEVK